MAGNGGFSRGMPFLPSSDSSKAVSSPQIYAPAPWWTIDLERIAVDVVLADQIGRIGLVDRRLQALALEDEFAAQIDIGRRGPHGETGDQAAFDQQMRIVAHDLAVLAGAGLGFVGVDDEIGRPRRIEAWA